MQTAEINLLKRFTIVAGVTVMVTALAPANRAQFTTVSSAPVYAPNGVYGSYGTYAVVPSAPPVTNSGSSFSTSATASALGGFPNAGAIIGGPLPAVGSTFSVPNFTPAPPQTNVMTGVPFQPGSRGFIMAVAGLRPNGTSAITPAEPNPTTTVILPPRRAGPEIVYRRAAVGSGALMTRETETEQIESYPVGAIVRRGAAPTTTPIQTAPPVSRIPIPVAPTPAPVVAEALPASPGPVVIHDFPPGAFLRK